MAQITTEDVRGLIAGVILNNKPGLIQAMNVTGNAVSPTISDDALLTATWNVFVKKGLDGLRNILNRVMIDHSKVSTQEAIVYTQKFNDADPNARFGDWFNKALTTFGDLLGGSTTVIGQPTEIKSTSAVSSTLVIVIVLIAIIAILIIAFS